MAARARPIVLLLDRARSRSRASGSSWPGTLRGRGEPRRGQRALPRAAVPRRDGVPARRGCPTRSRPSPARCRPPRSSESVRDVLDGRRRSRGGASPSSSPGRSSRPLGRRPLVPLGGVSRARLARSAAGRDPGRGSVVHGRRSIAREISQLELLGGRARRRRARRSCRPGARSSCAADRVAAARRPPRSHRRGRRASGHVAPKSSANARASASMSSCDTPTTCEALVARARAGRRGTAGTPRGTGCSTTPRSSRPTGRPR